MCKIIANKDRYITQPTIFPERIVRCLVFILSKEYIPKHCDNQKVDGDSDNLELLSC